MKVVAFIVDSTKAVSTPNLPNSLRSSIFIFSKHIKNLLEFNFNISDLFIFSSGNQTLFILITAMFTTLSAHLESIVHLSTS